MIKPEPTELQSQPEAPSAAPTRETIETYGVGESIVSASAVLAVDVIEERGEIPTSVGEPPYTPNRGQKLWYVKITWTNTQNEVADKDCFGPATMQLAAYDVDGVEMPSVDQPGWIEGNTCSSLMKGEGGTWITAFRGPDSEFGWLEFDDYNGIPSFVTLDPRLVLTESP